LPFAFRRAFMPDATPRLGGHWLSLITVHLGGILLWSGIFITDLQGLLHGMAYALWTISMLPIIVEIWRIVRHGLARLEQQSPVAPLDMATGD
jgi:hypothetical protein